MVQGDNRGRQPWPLWIVQLILEQLVNGTPPAVMPANILSHAKHFGVEVEKLPSVKHCQDMRIVLRILTETLAAYRLGKSEQWQQLFTDGTSRRQVALETVVLAIANEDEELVPYILSCACILEGESSEQTCAAVLKMI